MSEGLYDEDGIDGPFERRMEQAMREDARPKTRRRSSEPVTCIEYRVHWKRVGLKPKSKVFRSRKGAERRLVLLGPEPWLAYHVDREGQPKDPDVLHCCHGHECACEGLTVREAALAQRKEMPALEWSRIETRTVTETAWSEA